MRDLPSRSRSRSPRRDDEQERERRRVRDRDRSHHRHPHSDSHSHRRHHHHPSSRPSHHHPSRPQPADDNNDQPQTPQIPFNRAPLSKSSLHSHTPLFQSYLRHVKNIELPSLLETEVKGRWKSFIGKWNRGGLSTEWYTHASLPPPPSPLLSPLSSYPPLEFTPHPPPIPQVDDDDDEYGPVLPNQTRTTRTTTSLHGPLIPSRDDLLGRNETLDSDRQYALEVHRHERKIFRKEHKELLDDLLPKADPGSRERKLEKKRELTDKLKSFSQAKDAGAMEEVNERDLMGGGDDALEELQRVKRLREQKQNQRQGKREEEEMLRRKEREERVRGYREREEKVMEGLRGLVRERFGG
ncbi:hypothetical protein QBC40DRAFT_202167, partial [Triangularia verruculosa]